jgi:hypothetical protein
MKVSTENDNNFGYEKITILVDNMPLNACLFVVKRQKKLNKINKFYFNESIFIDIRTIYKVVSVRFFLFRE